LTPRPADFRSRVGRPKLLLHLIGTRQPGRDRNQRGFAMIVGILVVLGLIVASASLVSVVNGGLSAITDDSAANQAQAVAESGAEQIIAVLNQPENRKLLVSGDVAPTTTNWTTSNANLRSPCLSTSNVRPGTNNGYPSSTAVALADGSFRSLADITQTTGDQRFALKAVRYSTGANASSNRRTIYRTYQVGTATPSASAGTVPTGSSFSDLVNLSDPDASGAVTAGSNSGLIAITVEGRIYRNGVQVGSATVTKEYEVLAKCCGGSFGSNGSGGRNVSTNSLGSDSRYCGVDFGMIVGVNNGKMWSYFNNDRYTQRNDNNQVVDVRNLLGIVAADGDPFSRVNATIGGRSVGCRVIPGQCSTTSEVYTSSGANDNDLYFNQLASCTSCGNASDKAGTSASGIPIVPVYLATGLPTVASRYAVSWTVGGRPAARIDVASNGGYPSFTSIATTKLILRTRNDTSPPRVELCDATYATCSSTSWAQVSTAGTLTIGDDFNNNTYSNITSGSVNRWPTSWVESEPTTATGTTVATTQTPTTGSVAINSAALRLTGGSSATRSIQRVINLHALQSPSLSFTYTRSTLSGTKPLIVEYSTNNGTTYTQLVSLPATTASASTQRLVIPAAAQTGYTRIRFRLGATFTATEWVAIDNVQITNSAGGAASYNDWCEYKSAFPITSQFTGGFHCLGPSLNFVAGGTFIVDSTGGSLSFYYNNANDTRGQSLSTPVINMAGGGTLQHVNCNTNIPPTLAFTPSENCQTPIPETKYSAVGEQDMFNIFGRDTSPGGASNTMQWVRIGSFSTNVTTPGKIAGAWFYMPWGALYLVAEQCDGGALPAGFYTNDNNWNFGGRLWMRLVIPCGANYFRIPPSSVTNLAALIGTASLRSAAGDVDFVSWTGVDWVARAAISTRSNWSL
jgi:hypothetical protein